MRILDYVFAVSARRFYAAIFCCLLVIFLVHYLISGKAVYGDGIGYYAHLHDWTFDNDWDYTNEYKHIYSPDNNNSVVPQSVNEVQIVAETSSGRAANHFFPGMALLLLPYYFLADAVVGLLISVGVPVARNGYSDLYQLFTGVGSIIYLVIGLIFLEKLIFFYFKDTIVARVATLGIFLASPLLYYGSYDVINSHAVSFFLSSLFFYILLTRNNFSVLTLATVAGLAVMTRVQDIFMVGIFMLQNILQLQNKEQRWREVIKKVAVFLMLFLIVLLPLFIYISETFGSFTQHTYVQAFLKERETNSSIDLLGSLFNERNGLFSKSPLLLLLTGWYIYYCWYKKNFLFWQLALFFIFQYVVISLQGGWKAAAYGGRMYISCLPFFGVVLASMIHNYAEKQRTKIILLVLFAILINCLMIVTFVLFTKDAENGGRGLETMTQERLHTILNFSK